MKEDKTKEPLCDSLCDKGKPKEEDSQKKIEELQKQKEEYLAGWQRTRADFLNYKKEEMERIGELVKYAQEEWILKLLPILDNLDIIEKKLPENLKNDENVKGILQIKKQVMDFLKSQGVEEIKTVGEKFDPNFHEVVEEVEVNRSQTSVEAIDRGQTPVESVKEVSGGPTSVEVRRDTIPGEATAGTIIEEVQKGYRINGRLLRPAKVRVTK